MLSSDYIPITFKNQLSKMLSIPNSAVNHLIKTKELVTKMVGKKILVSNSSLKLFKSKFKRNDYYSKKETIKMIKDRGFYSDYDGHYKIYTVTDIGFPHTYQYFKEHKKLIVFSIGKMDFIEISSLHSLIGVLSDLEKSKQNSGPITKLDIDKKVKNTLPRENIKNKILKEIK